MIDEDYLAELRAEADEVRQDLAAREDLEGLDPIERHAAIMAATRVIEKKVSSETTLLVRKTRDQARVRQAYNAADGDAPPFSADQVDVLAAAIAELRLEFQATIDDALAPIRERLAAVEGSINMLLAMLGGNGAGAKQIEASESVVRKLRVR